MFAPRNYLWLRLFRAFLQPAEWAGAGRAAFKQMGRRRPPRCRPPSLAFSTVEVDEVLQEDRQRPQPQVDGALKQYDRGIVLRSTLSNIIHH